MAKEMITILKTTGANVTKEAMNNFVAANGLTPTRETSLAKDAKLAERAMGRAWLSSGDNFGYAEIENAEGNTIAAIAVKKGIDFKFFIVEIDSEKLMTKVSAGDHRELIASAVLATAVGTNGIQKALKLYGANPDHTSVWMVDTIMDLISTLKIQVENREWQKEVSWEEILNGAVEKNLPTANPFLSGKNSGSGAAKHEAGAFDISKFGDSSRFETEKLVTTMPDGYKPNQIIMDIARDIRDSYLFGEPICNIGLYGDAGSGKSLGSKDLAFLLGIPRYRFLFTTRTEAMDCYGTLIPNTQTESVNKEELIRKITDAVFDPEEAYRKTFKAEPKAGEDPTLPVVMEAIKTSDESKEFTFVPSEIIKCMRYGGCVEFGEAEVVKDQGVLTCLNNLLEKGTDATITLQNGETIRRHPLCIVVLTTNVGYAGCKPLNESVLSRMDEWIEMPTPGCKELVKRIKGVTQIAGKEVFEDDEMLKKMAETVVAMNGYAADQEYTSGSIGFRELTAWAKKALLLQMRETQTMGMPQKKVSSENIIKAAFATLLSKASQDKDDAADIRHKFEEKWGIEEVRNIEKALAK